MRKALLSFASSTFLPWFYSPTYSNLRVSSFPETPGIIYYILNGVFVCLFGFEARFQVAHTGFNLTLQQRMSLTF